VELPPTPAMEVRNLRVGLQIAHVVIIHDAHVAAAEGLGDGERHLGLGQHDLGPVFLDESAHFLFQGHGQSPAFLGKGLGDAQVGGGLVGLQIWRRYWPPTSISATSMETISNAVCESSEFRSTAWEIEFGLATRPYGAPRCRWP